MTEFSEPRPDAVKLTIGEAKELVKRRGLLMLFAAMKAGMIVDDADNAVLSEYYGK